MATYTSPAGTRRGKGEMVWLAVVTFVAASALVLALVAVQRGYPTNRVNGVGQVATPGAGPAVEAGTGAWVVPASVGGSGNPDPIARANGRVCFRCAP